MPILGIRLPAPAPAPAPPDPIEEAEFGRTFKASLSAVDSRKGDAWRRVVAGAETGVSEAGMREGGRRAGALLPLLFPSDPVAEAGAAAAPVAADKLCAAVEPILGVAECARGAGSPLIGGDCSCRRVLLPSLSAPGMPEGDVTAGPDIEAGAEAAFLKGDKGNDAHPDPCAFFLGRSFSDVTLASEGERSRYGRRVGSSSSARGVVGAA